MEQPSPASDPGNLNKDLNGLESLFRSISQSVSPFDDQDSDADSIELGCSSVPVSLPVRPLVSGSGNVADEHEVKVEQEDQQVLMEPAEAETWSLDASRNVSTGTDDLVTPKADVVESQTDTEDLLHPALPTKDSGTLTESEKPPVVKMSFSVAIPPTTLLEPVDVPFRHVSTQVCLTCQLETVDTQTDDYRMPAAAPTPSPPRFSGPIVAQLPRDHLEIRPPPGKRLVSHRFTSTEVHIPPNAALILQPETTTAVPKRFLNAVKLELDRGMEQADRVPSPSSKSEPSSSAGVHGDSLSPFAGMFPRYSLSSPWIPETLRVLLQSRRHLSKLISVERDRNGGALVLRAQYSDVAQLSAKQRLDFSRLFNLASILEEEHCPVAVIGIVHGAAGPMPDFLDYIGKKYPGKSNGICYVYTFLTSFPLLLRAHISHLYIRCFIHGVFPEGLTYSSFVLLKE